MGSKKISQLPEHLNPESTDLFATVNDETTKKVTLSGLTEYFQRNLVFSDISVTGGTYSDGNLIFTNNTGGTISISGIYTGDDVTTGGTYTNGTLVFTNKTGGTYDIGGLFTLNVADSSTISFQGSGDPDDPLTATSLVKPTQNGIVSGGQVTWISGYTYSISYTVYYINGVLYTSPYTEITLDPADVTNNRIDVFVVTTSNTAEKITGVASTNPEQPSINTGTQLQVSFALVIANTTSPVGLSQEYIYRENIGTPTEWAPSATGNIVVNSSTSPSSGTYSIEGTSVAAGNSITLVDSSASKIAATKNVLIFYIKSKSTWNNNRRLNLQFRNGVTNVGLSVAFGNNLYGFDSTITNSYQRIVIPLSDFSITPSDDIDRLIITVSGSSGTLGFYIDDIELQGANLIPQQIGTTDNVGVFYVSKNFSGIGNALVNGYTLTSITSTNTGYNTQLLSARMGDQNKAYPCPWSARNAAMEAMTAGTIKRALIVVNGGNQWTFGSNTLTQNGDSTGNPSVNEVPDIKFTSFTDISSLAKHNIFYQFNPNSTLLALNKTVAIHIAYNVDLTDTYWRSGFYGNGTFLIPYGTSQGVSQRFIQINNARAEFTYESDYTVGNRAWFYIFDFKEINIKINRFYGDNSTSLVFEGGQTREGDGSPSTLNAIVNSYIYGNLYSPYPLATTNTNINNSRSIISMGSPFGTTRVKNRYYEISNGFIEATNSTGACFMHMGSSFNVCNNLNLHVKASNFKQIVGSFVTGNIFTTLFILSDNVNGVYTNNNITIELHNFDIESPICMSRHLFTPNAGSSNNNITYKGSNIIRRPYSVTTGIDYAFQKTIFSIPCTSAVITAANKPRVMFDFTNVVALVDSVFSDVQGQENIFTYSSRCIIKGDYRTTSNEPVIYLRQTGNSAVLKDAILISGGSYCIDGNASGKLIYTNDVTSNVAHNSTNVTVQGVGIITDTTITNYL